MVVFLYSLQVLVAILTIVAIIIQKGGEGGAGPAGVKIRMFGARERSTSMTRITSILACAFVLVSIALGIAYKKQHKAEQITSTANMVNK